ncbi:MarR family winged helix-turn-helix transcriptional regulator [Ruminiclostridium josui]|uniref:MarR family winged helix-turn-helix transcriptional regulator n=1 Tax=Ruminiclostridium josui TaxID=1499 RepID=UPI000462E9F7|nr:MarR family transcriptional regulator [Ruminiclostridium josui]
MSKEQEYITASLLVKLGNAISWYKNQNMKSIELTASQSEAIQYILRNKDYKRITAADLMRNLELAQSTIAGIIRRLEQKNLIKCTTAPDDKRQTIISVTPQSLKLEEQLRKTAVETEHILLSGMSENEQKEFNRLLQIALENMNNIRNK